MRVRISVSLIVVTKNNKPRRNTLASLIKQQNPDHEKLTIVVASKTRELLTEESKRRNKATGARWPLGALVDEIVSDRFRLKVNGSSDADEFAESLST